MTVASQFIKNLKVVSDKKSFTHDETKLITLAVQELSTLSPLELFSLLDNIEILAQEASVEMTQDDFDALRKDLIED